MTEDVKHRDFSLEPIPPFGIQDGKERGKLRRICPGEIQQSGSYAADCWIHYTYRLII